jgi:hypothetical protein
LKVRKITSEVTRISAAIERGDVHAVDELFPIIYQKLRQLAAQKLSKELPGQILQAIAPVHEAYLRIVGFENQNRTSLHTKTVGTFFPNIL